MNQSGFKYFVIFGSMRSGSNLLEQSLNQFPSIICYGELFNPSFVGDYENKERLGYSVAKREKDPFGLLDAMNGETDDKIPGFRIFRDHDPRIIEKTLNDPECAKIILQRDLLDSFISLRIAGRTGQWLLRDAPHRKSSKVHFDAYDFQSYREKQDVFYQNIRRTLQETGQTAFWLNYPEQRELPVLNGLAKFLGVSKPIKSVKEILRRQNPGPLSEKVENYREMMAALGKTESDEIISLGAKKTRANIPRMVTCVASPLLFAPIPGGPNEEILRWMYNLDGGENQLHDYFTAVTDEKILHTKHSQRTLLEWMRANPDVFVMTAVRHPLARAYDAFMSKIFMTGPNTYDFIRKQLIQNFDIDIPNAEVMDECDRDALTDAGYETKHHRLAFHNFLRFLKSNLDGQTSIRIDGLWAEQMSFLPGFNSAVPIALIAKEGCLDPSFRYVETLLDLEQPKLGAPIKPDHAIQLSEIYTRQTENLARKVYATDYARFGFDDYQAALEA